jgi:diguanylate cyclase (GGDEF)-like protein
LGNSDVRGEVEAVIRHTAEVGTQALAGFLITGNAITQEESKEWDAAGEAAYLLDVSLADVTKLYLFWRDVAMDLLREIAAAREIDAGTTLLALEVARIGADVSLVRMAKRFESTRRELEAQLAEKQARLEHQALHDPLTGLANRALFLDRLAHALAMVDQRSRRPAVLFVDLDHFKLVNDRAGHSAGDQILVEVAARLRRLIRPGDTMARLGGDEFAILCDSLQQPAEEALSIAKDVVVALQRSFEVGGRTLFVAASVGVAVPTPGIKPERLLSSADKAMYRAKQRGRGRAELYDPTIDLEALRHAELANALHNALADHQLHVVYQPVFDVATRQEVSREALSRWQHPTLGNVPPAEFIPVAEETGVILEIGHWVLAEACHQCATWRRNGCADVGVAVNVSGRQLEEPDFQADVRSVLQASTLPPEALTLEITESLLMAGQPEARMALEQLQASGVHIAVDDFGTGYSSLSWLAQLPLDVLKIDRSFIIALGLLERESAIVEATVRLAHTLGFTVIAEGVETDAQLAMLEQIGCDQAQGYLLGRPKAIDATPTAGRAAPTSAAQ